MENMKSHFENQRKAFAALLAFLFSAAPLAAQTSPFGTFVDKVASELSGPMSIGLSLIIVICGGVYLFFSEGRGKGYVASAIFAVVIIMGASRIVAWAT